MSANCIVLIPYYTNDLSVFEKYSLDRVLKILSNHPISFFGPEGLDVSPEYSHVNTQRFEEKYFQTMTTYNKLLLTEHFYKRFRDHKYMLIYQLDALVFRDELDYWCSLGYDYYGAPWNRKWRRRYYNFYGLRNKKVGNGGFSLRKTEVFYKMANKIKNIRKFIRFGEDIFWCNYGNLIYPQLKIINEDLAIKFAFESESEKLFHINGDKLPFGCHAFEKNDLSFWKRILPDLPFESM